MYIANKYFVGTICHTLSTTISVFFLLFWVLIISILVWISSTFYFKSHFIHYLQNRNDYFGGNTRIMGFFLVPIIFQTLLHQLYNFFRIPHGFSVLRKSKLMWHQQCGEFSIKTMLVWLLKSVHFKF